MLSKENQELLDQLYPKGYVVKDEEKSRYHVLFVKIFETKGRHNKLSPMVQQFNIKDWQVLKRQIDRGWKLSAITGYNEFEVIHDPTAPVKEAEPEPVKKTVRKPGPKSTKKAEPTNK